MFKKLSEQFQCHIRYKSPASFYRLWFYITVPGTDFETPRAYHTVHASDVPSLGSAFHTVEFITVEHYTGVQHHDEFILIGQEDPGLLNRINFTVQPKKTAAEYQAVKPSVHKISNTVYVSSIQFDEPFAYSTSKWVNGNDCQKDMSRITGMQPHYQNRSQSVKVVTDNMAEPYTYLLSSATSRPYMRLFVPGGLSLVNEGHKSSQNPQRMYTLELVAVGFMKKTNPSSNISQRTYCNESHDAHPCIQFSVAYTECHDYASVYKITII